MGSRLSTLVVFLLLTGPGVSGQPTTFIVAPLPGPDVDALQISDAVALASNGDLILVRPGAYDSFSVVDKSLIIQGDPNAFVQTDPDDPAPPVAITIAGIEGGDRVIIRGLTVFQFGAGPNPMIEISACSSAVTFEEVFFDFLGSGPVVRVTDCASVTFDDTLFQATGGSLPPTLPGPDNAALDVLRSTVFLHDCTVIGLDGESAATETSVATPGSPGVRLRASSMTATGSDIRGGRGGNNLFPGGVGAAGGPGVLVDAEGNQGSFLRHIDDVHSGGFGGAGAAADGEDGEAIEIANGSQLSLPAKARSFRFSSPAHMDDDLTLTFTGIPGDQMLLVFYFDTIFQGQWLPGPGGVLHVSPVLLVPLGVLDGTELTLSFPADGLLTLPLAPSAFQPMHGQVLYSGTSGDSFLSGPTMTVFVE